MGMILRIASSRIVGQGDIVGRSGYFSLNLSANSVMRGRLDARRTLKSLVADLRINTLVVGIESGSQLGNLAIIPSNIIAYLPCEVFALDSYGIYIGFHTFIFHFTYISGNQVDKIVPAAALMVFNKSFVCF